MKGVLGITAALVAALTAAGGAAAAEVSVYGLVDMGFSVSRKGGDEGDGRWTAQMKSGMRNSSRVGLKGTEDLGGGWRTGFILESQFAADTGALQTSGVLWERESSLWVDGPAGRLTVGRVGLLKGVVGSTAILNSYRVNPFGSQMSSFITGFKAYTTGTGWYADNGVVWRSPDFGGFTVHLQYSNAVSGQEGERIGDKDRYWAGAVRWMKGPLLLQMIVDTTNRGAKEKLSDALYADPWSAGVQAAYDFGVVKPYVMAEVFRTSTLNTVGGHLKGTGLYDGAGGTLVLQWPLLGGKAKLGGGFLKASSSGGTVRAQENDVTRAGVSAGWDYVLTKRTNLYWDLGWTAQKLEPDASGEAVRNSGVEAAAGIVHYF